MALFACYMLLLIACLVALLLNRQSLPSFFYYFLYLLLAVIIFELAGQTLTSSGVSANFLDHIYQPVEVTILALIYYHAVTYPAFRRSLYFVVPGFWIFSAIASVRIEGIHSVNTISFIGSTLVIIYFSFAWIVRTFRQPPSGENLLAIPFFWINTGHLFFYFGTFFQMGLDSYLRMIDTELAGRLVVINYALNFTLYFLYLVAFSCRKVYK